MTNGWPAPASRELGANWVEVTVWERVKWRFNQRRNDLKTWPATPVGRLVRIQQLGFVLYFAGVASYNKGAAGVGQPFGRFAILGS